MPADAKPGEITVATWGGAYAESQNRAYFAPFRKKEGIAVQVVSHKGVTKPPAGAGWDVVDMRAGDVKKACSDGLLVKLDTSRLAATVDGTPASTDFLPGALHECGVGSVAWSSAIAFDRRDYKKSSPERATDLFDTAKFPGKRALPRNPKFLFETASIAAGIAPDEVYKSLATDEGIAKVLAELDKIKPDIVWWDNPAEPLAFLADGKADMALAFNGRIFASIVGENQPFGTIWDGQVFDMDMWAIPKSSTRADAAMQFIAFATRPDRLAAQTQWFPYGPLRKSALKIVGKHAEIDIDMSAYIPTAEGNMRNALAFDAGFWAENEEKLAARFEQWRSASSDAGKDKTPADGEKKSD
ncbi:MAG: extracellular solute-binding protein [Pseudomonadota bacterium]|nr:extracellular solute-binding protein [Pseudomonadota bacterium]